MNTYKNKPKLAAAPDDAAHERRDSMRAVRAFTVPRTIRAGRVLVHNHIAHAIDTPCGMKGFGAWTQRPSNELERCKCG
jgi:hypothetical protein